MKRPNRLIAIILGLVLAGCATTSKQPDAIELARAQFARGDYDRGYELLEAAMLKDRASLVLANYYRAQIVSKAKEDRAIAFFKKITQDPSAPDEAYYNMAFAFIDKIPRVGPMGAGFLSKRSIAQFKTVYDRRSDDWIANYGIGMNYLHWPDYFKKTEGTLQYLEKCLELQRGRPLKPQYILSYLRFGDALVRGGQIEHAYEIWREGEKLFPGHPDLVDRLRIPPGEIADAIKQLYLPNNSIGAINTDISILWAKEVPREAVPLRRNALSQPGSGGQLKSAQSRLDDADVGLFAWFTRNLPYLSDKRAFDKVDMAPLGVQPAGSDRLANTVAHGMISGFLAEMDGNDPARLSAKAAEVDGYTRPFFHEGIGMAHAATVSLDDVAELGSLVQWVNAIDPNFKRLHLAGAGMWFGLESAREPQRVAQAFGHLGPFGEAYAYEGYGFSRTLFHFSANADVLAAGTQLAPAAAHNFYHGAGRALWILKGGDTAALRATVDTLPAEYRDDAYSGYGMGVAFTRVDAPGLAFSLLERAPQRSAFVTGMTMGYVIRALSDPAYWKETVAGFPESDRCRVERLVELGRTSLAQAERGGGDLHSNWRDLILKRVTELHYDSDGARSSCA